MKNEPFLWAVTEGKKILARGLGLGVDTGCVHRCSQGAGAWLGGMQGAGRSCLESGKCFKILGEE